MTNKKLRIAFSIIIIMSSFYFKLYNQKNTNKDKLTAITDKNGIFHIRDLPFKKYDIKVLGIQKDRIEIKYHLTADKKNQHG